MENITKSDDARNDNHELARSRMVYDLARSNCTTGWFSICGNWGNDRGIRCMGKLGEQT
jgi:hypothetical protein